MAESFSATLLPPLLFCAVDCQQHQLKSLGRLSTATRCAPLGNIFHFSPVSFCCCCFGFFSLPIQKKKFEKKKKNKKGIHLAETCGEPHRRTAPPTTHTEHYNIVHVGTDTAHHARIERSWIIIIKAITIHFFESPKKDKFKQTARPFMSPCVSFFRFF